MSDSLKVLHFGGQCPWHMWAVKQARKAASRMHGTVETVDVQKHPDLAARFQMYFPFMTVINNSVRIPSPVSSNYLIQVIRAGLETFPTAPFSPGPPRRAQEIRPLTAQNVSLTCPLCIPESEGKAFRAKHDWASKVLKKTRGKILGFIAFEDNQPKCTVEFLPAHLVPYPLPEKEDTCAFITCLYPSDGSSDYRPHLLEHLTEVLPTLGYRKLQVIAGRRTPYPNGPALFFLLHGFTRRAQVDTITLREGLEDLILMEKAL